MPDRGQRIAYQVPPAIGDIAIWEQRNRAYVVASVRPYTRKDGTRSYVIRWQCECVTCHELFTITTGLAGHLGTTRCELHRSTRAQAMARHRKRN